MIAGALSFRKWLPEIRAKTLPHVRTLSPPPPVGLPFSGRMCYLGIRNAPSVCVCVSPAAVQTVSGASPPGLSPRGVFGVWGWVSGGVSG